MFHVCIGWFHLTLMVWKDSNFWECPLRLFHHFLFHNCCWQLIKLVTYKHIYKVKIAHIWENAFLSRVKCVGLLNRSELHSFRQRLQPILFITVQLTKSFECNLFILTWFIRTLVLNYCCCTWCDSWAAFRQKLRALRRVITACIRLAVANSAF